MSYNARITQAHPCAFVVLIDRSGSMAENVTYMGREQTKAQAVAKIVNALIAELVSRSRRPEGYNDYYDIAVVGYNGSRVSSLLENTTLDRPFLTSSRLAAVAKNETVTRHRTLPDGRVMDTVTLEKSWITPYSDLNTPMVGAFDYVVKILKTWVASSNNSECYPPTVINITDGEATDGTPEALCTAADRIKGISTNDGNTLLINIHIATGSQAPVLFPTSYDDLPAEQRHARLLFDLSSEMPALYRDEIEMLRGDGTPRRGGVLPIETSYRGMAYNATITDMIRVMNIGTITSKLLL